MSVQDRAGFHTARNGEMEQGFRGRAAIALYHVRRIVDLQKLRRRKRALVQSCRSNRQPQRLAGNHRAKVSTRPQSPSAGIEFHSNLRQASGYLREASTVSANSRVGFGAIPTLDAFL